MPLESKSNTVRMFRLYFKCILGHISISRNTSFIQVSWILEVARSKFRIVGSTLLEIKVVTPWDSPRIWAFLKSHNFWSRYPIKVIFCKRNCIFQLYIMYQFERCMSKFNVIDYMINNKYLFLLAVMYDGLNSIII